jgi:hypothetical protein
MRNQVSSTYHKPARTSKSSPRKHPLLPKPQEEGCNILTKNIKIEKEYLQEPEINGLFIYILYLSFPGKNATQQVVLVLNSNWIKVDPL